jgi:uncharacterized protein (TIGR03382 family)
VTGQACLAGECANPCGPGEFPCPFGFFCEDQPGGGRFCVTDPCAAVQCQPGFACDRDTGMCADLCDGVTCPTGLTCFGGLCQDCFALGCDAGELCVRNDANQGECRPDPCFGVDCEDGEACIDGTCTTVTCDPVCTGDHHCVGGTCVDDPCANVNCAGGRVCDPSTGTCVPDRCDDTVCGQGLACRPSDGMCIPDPCATIVCPPGLECTVEFDGTGTCDVPQLPARETVTAAGGGGCSTSGGSSGAIAFAILLFTWRRRTRRPPSRSCPS